MTTVTRWTNCRREGCGRVLPVAFQIYGFCDATCFSLHGDEKKFHTRMAEEAFQRENFHSRKHLGALEAFKIEGEPNGGTRS